MFLDNAKLNNENVKQFLDLEVKSSCVKIISILNSKVAPQWRSRIFKLLLDERDPVPLATLAEHLPMVIKRHF